MTIALQSVTKLLKNYDYIMVYHQQCGHCKDTLEKIYKNYEQLYDKLVKYGINVYLVDFSVIDKEFKNYIKVGNSFSFPSFHQKIDGKLRSIESVPINQILQPDIVEYG